MQDKTFISVGTREEYQPPESQGEIDNAVTLAQKDPRLREKVKGLKGHGLLIEPDSGLFFDLFGDLGAGNRVLWITFSKKEERDPLYCAVVDLTENKVLDAGKEVKE
jgi:hypothetical protein